MLGLLRQPKETCDTRLATPSLKKSGRQEDVISLSSLISSLSPLDCADEAVWEEIVHFSDSEPFAGNSHGTGHSETINQRKFSWNEDFDGRFCRPLIPFSYKHDEHRSQQAKQTDGMAASMYSWLVRVSTRKALQQIFLIVCDCVALHYPCSCSGPVGPSTNAKRRAC